jgi:hypothetical protein
MRIVQRCRGARFLFEAHEAIVIGADARRQHLDGDHAIEPAIAGAIDLAHAASPERREDFIWTESRADG